MDIRIADEVGSLVLLGAMELDGCAVGPSGEELLRRMEAREAALREAWAGRGPGEIPVLQPARRLYRSARLDPTRERPSSEALLRRILKGGALPRINSAVDLCNLCAVSYFLSIGLYDRDRLAPPLEVGLGGPGERYAGLGKPDVHLAGRLRCRDRLGAFGNPSSDSLRSSVDESSTRLLWLIYAPADYDPARLEEHLAWSARQALECGLCGEAGRPRLIAAS